MNQSESQRRAATAEATRALLRCERFVGMVYEPVRADEGICDAAHENGNALFMTSIGFLDYNTRDITNVITEPRPEEAVAYAEKAVNLATHKVALLLPLELLARADAAGLWGLPLVRVYVLSKGLSYRTTRMAWYVFERGAYDAPVLKRI